MGLGRTPQGLGYSLPGSHNDESSRAEERPLIECIVVPRATLGLYDLLAHGVPSGVGSHAALRVQPKKWLRAETQQTLGMLLKWHHSSLGIFAGLALVLTISLGQCAQMPVHKLLFWQAEPS